MTSHRERLLEAVLESAVDHAIIAFDPQGTITTWSEGARRIMGWTEAEMLGQPVSRVFTERDARNQVPRQAMDAALAQGCGSGERWHRRRDGSEFWADGTTTPLRDAQGLHLGYITILRDRSEQRRVAERHREDSEFLRGVLTASGDCIKVLDLDGRVTFVTETGLQLLGFDHLDEVRGAAWSGFWQGEAGVTARAAVDTARAGGAGQFRGSIVRPDGLTRWWDVLITPILGAEGAPERLLAVSRDITAMVEAEARLAEIAERQRLATEAGDFGTWDHEVACGDLRWDPRCRALFGILDDRPVSFEDFIRALHPKDCAAVRAATASALDPAGDGRLYCEFRSIGVQDGVERWLSSSGQARFEDGRAARLIGVITDITQRRTAEENARLLGEELQHRIKNTLAMVQAIVRQTLRGKPSLPQAQEAIDKRLAAMGRAHGMLTSGGWTSSDLRQVVDSALDLHDDRSGRFVIEGPPVHLHAQAAMSLALLLHELLTNATKYGALSVEGGQVAIGWTLHPAPGATGASDTQQLTLTWRESGGPAVSEPEQRGFGSRLIERSLGTALNGNAVLEFRNHGVVCTVKGLIEPSPEPR